MKKFELFPTPVMEFDFTNHSNINQVLKNLNNFKLGNHGLIKNGNSSFNLNQRILFSPNLIELKNDFQKCVDLYCSELKIQNGYIFDSWFNILEKDGKVFPHSHGASIVSGAFYPLLEENTCNIIFKSPINSSQNFISINKEDHFHPNFIMPIKQNHLYLFPGWLTHYTEKNKGNKRIVISFNTKFY